MTAASAEALLADLRQRGVALSADGELLRWRAPRGVVGSSDLDALRSLKREVLDLLSRSAGARFATLQAGKDGSPAQLLDRFLNEDASIPVAVLHSRVLDRDFVLARDANALEALANAERRLPVLTFADCEKLAGLGPADFSVVLDVRAEFGPSAELVSVGPRLG